MKPTGYLSDFGQDNDSPEKDEFLRNNPEYWTCTNCGKLTKDIIFEEGDSNICYGCYVIALRRTREGLETDLAHLEGSY